MQNNPAPGSAERAGRTASTGRELLLRLLHGVATTGLVLMTVASSGVLWFFANTNSKQDHLRNGYELFLRPAAWVFRWPELRFSTTKDLTLLNSNVYLAPLAVVIASFVWALIPAAIGLLLGKDRPRPARNSVTGFMAGATAALAVLALDGWLLLGRSDLLPYGGGTVHGGVITWCAQYAFLPAALPDYATSSLEYGGDTLHGLDNLYLTSQVNPAFAVLVWGSLIGLILHCCNRWKSNAARRGDASDPSLGTP